LNNYRHASVDGPKSDASNVSLLAVARACGYVTARAKSVGEIGMALKGEAASARPTFIEIPVNSRTSNGLPRPDRNFAHRKVRFIESLLSEGN
jgi:thiamine pyrophosphate-dependent acetolactate synthase large subunit-like protein